MAGGGLGRRGATGGAGRGQSVAAAAAADADAPASSSCGPRRCRCRRRPAPLLFPALSPTLLLLLLLLVLFPLLRPCSAGIHVSHVMQDGRALIPLSPNFGFDPRGGGGVVLTLRAPLLVYRPQPPPGVDPVPPSLENFGLLLVPVGEQQAMHDRIAQGVCPLGAAAAGAGAAADDAAAVASAQSLPLLTFADAGVQAVADNRADNYTLHVEMATGGGWYGLWFVSCEAHTPVTFSTRAELYNPPEGGSGIGGVGGGVGGDGDPGASSGGGGRRSYLSVGQRELDEVYAVFSAAYLLAAAVWLVVLLRARFGGGASRARAGGAAAQAAASGASPEEVAAAARGAPVVRPLHWLMAALSAVKAGTLVCQAVSIRLVEVSGRAEGAWARARVAFFALRGVLLFCVLVLLASGWSLLADPAMDPAAQRVLMAVLPIQAFANVALAFAAEDDAPSAPGLSGWLGGAGGGGFFGAVSWLHVFRAADLACCLAVLVPIVLTAARLRREAAAGDGKARRALDRLVAFRRFYVVFVAWVWATRVASVLLRGALPLTKGWVAAAVEEGATLMFYVFVGACFRPRAVGESYAHLTDEELAEIEL